MENSAKLCAASTSQVSLVHMTNTAIPNRILLQHRNDPNRGLLSVETWAASFTRSRLSREDVVKGTQLLITITQPLGASCITRSKRQLLFIATQQVVSFVTA